MSPDPTMFNDKKMPLEKGMPLLRSLFFIKFIHTLIFVFFSICIGIVIFSALTGVIGWLTWTAFVLVLLEAAVFSRQWLPLSIDRLRRETRREQWFCGQYFLAVVVRQTVSRDSRIDLYHGFLSAGVSGARLN
jgi:hypothetical protein